MHYLDETHILIFLVQLLILMGAARGLGELFRRFKQPALTAEILVGVLLGPTILGRYLPGIQQALFPPDAIQQSMLETVAWLGILFLLLETGLEIDFSIAWRQRGNAFVIAITDIIVPIIVAFTAVVFLPAGYMVDPAQRLIFSLFMATVMTISALPVSARVLHDLKLLKTDLGFLVMSALTVNDIVGWVLFTIIIGIFTTATVSVGPILFIFAATVGFAVLALTLGRRMSNRLLDAVTSRNFPEPGTSLTITVVLGLMFGAFTQKLGIHALFGFLIAGIIVGEARSLSEQTRSVISQMVHSLFVPLFFANIGLKLDFAASFDLFLVTLMCVVGIGGRYLGAWIGVTLRKVPVANRDMIAIAHTPGGMMEIVVALLALEAGLITSVVFVAIVFSAVFSSVLMGPWMARSMKRRVQVAARDYLESGSVVGDLCGRTREKAVRVLAAKAAALQDAAGVEEIAGGVMKREVEFGTALGEGIAIPHVYIERLKEPVLVYGRCTDGIEWNAPDGQPVNHVFLLLSPSGTEDIHVQILASIARAMQSLSNRERLVRAAGASSLFGELQILLR